MDGQARDEPESEPVLAGPECSQCGHGNRPAARYCSRCGSVVAGARAGGAARTTPGADALEAMDDDRLAPWRPPGWYPDPFRRHRSRWWTGTSWSWYAADDTVQWDPTPIGEARPEPPGLRGIGLALTGYGLGVALAVGIVVLFSSTGRPGGRSAELLASEAGLWAGFIGACVYVSRRRGTGSLSRDFGLAFRPIDVAFGLAGSLVARVLAGFAVLPFVFLFRHARAPERDVLGSVTHGALGWLVVVFVACVGAPVVEELFFRGLVQVRLIGRWGPVTGIGVTSVLFGAAHLIAWRGPITLLYGIAVAAGGVVLGEMRYHTGRLGTSMAAHMFFNGQALLALALLR
ncbi:MAG: CPBP family intramembrane metalloprotease [Actinobacteria bacterium]|nr:MAG: CPBP family intramembrane metalloprotease [Actinomycetota bacterium]